MVIAGEAAQTFAAFRTFARNTGEAFASVGVLADKACLPQRTVKRHISKLSACKLLKHKGRARRRTVTYSMDLRYLNANENAKFAILPRWAASLLPTWAERAVFALVVSRDSLNDSITGGLADGEDVYGRLQYSASTMAKDSGLSLRAIGHAKDKLVRRGLIKIDPAMYWQDKIGRIRTMADTLILNPDFRVPNELVHRCAKAAPATYSKSSPGVQRP